MSEPSSPAGGSVSQGVYDASEVDSYLDQLHSHIAALEAELAAGIRQPVEPADRSSERVLGEALLKAQRRADDLVAQALLETQRILEDSRAEQAEDLDAARREAATIVDRARHEADAVIAAAERAAESTVNAAHRQVHARVEQGLAVASVPDVPISAERALLAPPEWPPSTVPASEPERERAARPDAPPTVLSGPFAEDSAAHPAWWPAHADPSPTPLAPDEGAHPTHHGNGLGRRRRRL